MDRKLELARLDPAQEHSPLGRAEPEQGTAFESRTATPSSMRATSTQVWSATWLHVLWRQRTESGPVVCRWPRMQECTGIPLIKLIGGTEEGR